MPSYFAWVSALRMDQPIFCLLDSLIKCRQLPCLAPRDAILPCKAAKEIEDLKSCCTRASEDGKYEVSILTDYISTSRACNVGLAKRELEKHAERLGFPRFAISNGPSYLVKVSWKDVPRDASAEPPKKRLKGHVRTCQVCEEKKSIVVLAPCGHVLCEDCREKQTKQNNQNCPFCRQRVICATDGLFFS